MKLHAESLAKVNRYLRVLGRRGDGYHELDTMFQTIDLADGLQVVEADAGLTLACDDPAVPVDDRNLVIRAGKLLAREAGIAAAAAISLRKRIPAGGGLGGGSSNAAVALVLLARLWKLPFSEADLARLASQLGSDVPFFLCGGTARGTGRGEWIEPMPDAPGAELLLVIPPFPVSTGAVYAGFEAAPDAPAPPAGAFFGGNDLTAAILKAEPRMEKYVAAVRLIFPDFLISGSGSVVAASAGGTGGDRETRLRNLLPEARVLKVRTVARPEYRRRCAMDLS